MSRNKNQLAVKRLKKAQDELEGTLVLLRQISKPDHWPSTEWDFQIDCLEGAVIGAHLLEKGLSKGENRE